MGHYIDDHLLNSETQVLAVDGNDRIPTAVKEKTKSEKGSALVAICKAMISGDGLDYCRAFFFDPPIVASVRARNGGLHHAQVGNARQAAKGQCFLMSLEDVGEGYSVVALTDRPAYSVRGQRS